MKRILTQIKMFSIRSASETISGMGWCDVLQGINWIDAEEWESDEKCSLLLAEAYKKWQKQYQQFPHSTTPNEPKLFIFWKTIKTDLREC